MSLNEVLSHLHQDGRLLALLRDVAVELFLLSEAAERGLQVSTEELQQAADHFRRCRGMNTAAVTFNWLERENRSVADFEAGLERKILAEKLKQLLTSEQVAGHYSVRSSDYDRVNVRRLVVSREDIAKELLDQICQEGRDFAELVTRHSIQPKSGGAGWLYRRQLPTAVATRLFAARNDEVIGPILTRDGFELFRVEAFQPAVLDELTRNYIQQELFEQWLRDQMSAMAMEFPILDNL